MTASSGPFRWNLTAAHDSHEPAAGWVAPGRDGVAIAVPAGTVGAAWTARRAIETMAARWSSRGGGSGGAARDFLCSAVVDANAALWAERESSSILALSHAVSVAAVAVIGDTVGVVVCGGCMCLRWRQGTVAQWSGHHSGTVLDDEALRQAALREERSHLFANALGLCSRIEPDVVVCQAAAGDCYLLAPASTWRSGATASALAAAMAAGPEPERASELLDPLLDKPPTGTAWAMLAIGEPVG